VLVELAFAWSVVTWSQTENKCKAYGGHISMGFALFQFVTTSGPQFLNSAVVVWGLRSVINMIYLVFSSPFTSSFSHSRPVVTEQHREKIVRH
jgi:hypothetical protein